MRRGGAVDDERETRLAAVAARPERDWGTPELDELSPLFDALALTNAPRPEDVTALARGLGATLDDEAARALSDGAASAREVSERFERLRALVAAHDALASPRARTAAQARRG